VALPRSKYVLEGQEGVYHCFSRCVRRAFLCGFDALTGRDFSHRKALLVERLRYLAAVFAIEVCAYSVMANHYHVILRTRPDIVALWSDREVATRWLTLFPHHRNVSSTLPQPAESEIQALADCLKRIAQLRQRLSSLSWFMGRLNEFIARAANQEDQVKGRFWESRFKCQALLDEAAIVACMAYVDLNPIRAGKAATPEQSNFTSIQERIRAWQKATMTAPPASPDTTAQGLQPPYDSASVTTPEDAAGSADAIPFMSHPPDNIADPSRWLCPIQSDSERRGILPITAAEYFDLVDKSGRIIRSGKQGTIDPHLVPILRRIGANPDAWPQTLTRFGSNFRLAAGLLGNLRHFANKIGRRWLIGATAARAAFLSPSPQPA
jgi:hypothetical protein